MAKTVVTTKKAPGAIGPYSQGIKANGFVFASGQLGLIPETGEFAGDGIEAQTRQALANVKNVLEAAGSALERVVFLYHGRFCRKFPCSFSVLSTVRGEIRIPRPLPVGTSLARPPKSENLSILSGLPAVGNLFSDASS